MTLEHAMAAVANVFGLTWIPENAEGDPQGESLEGVARRRPMHTPRRTPSEAPR